ncbi:MAG: hypothetical protein HUK02_09485 [Bacteroidaceae bacterium]|nr:hypothetical protein [Bacteroidaceae bacterium]
MQTRSVGSSGASNYLCRKTEDLLLAQLPAEAVQNIKNSETFHRYLALTFTYNFDAKAKKKQQFR